MRPVKLRVCIGMCTPVGLYSLVARSACGQQQPGAARRGETLMVPLCGSISPLQLHFSTFTTHITTQPAFSSPPPFLALPLGASTQPSSKYLPSGNRLAWVGKRERARAQQVSRRRRVLSLASTAALRPGCCHPRASRRAGGGGGLLFEPGALGGGRLVRRMRAGGPPRKAWRERRSDTSPPMGNVTPHVRIWFWTDESERPAEHYQTCGDLAGSLVP